MIDKHTDTNPKERLREKIATLAARIDAATYELLVLIRKFDEQEGWSNGFLSCAHWLTWRIGLAPSAARERVRVARALGELPLMSEAMQRGKLSYSKVRALTRIARPDTEKSLVELGRASTATHIERVVRAWRRADRTIETRHDELRDAASHFSTHIDENGMFVIRGRLAPEVGEVLTKALDAASEKLYDENRGARDKDGPSPGRQAAGRCSRTGGRERARGRARSGFKRRALPSRRPCERRGIEASRGRIDGGRCTGSCFRGSSQRPRFRGSGRGRSFRGSS